MLINQTFLVDVSYQLFLVLIIIGHVSDPDVHLLHQFIITKTLRTGITQLLSWLGDVGKSLPILIREGLLFRERKSPFTPPTTRLYTELPTILLVESVAVIINHVNVRQC